MYTKPEVVRLDEPLAAIQGAHKPCSSADNGGGFNATSGAYESDE